MLGIIIALLLLGVLLLLLEILFVPGTTIVGIGGFILLAIGVYLAYTSQGVRFGHFTVLASLVIIIAALVVMLKGKTWELLTLKTQLTGVARESVDHIVSIGETGTTIGRLNPSGNANFGGRIVEVYTTGDFIDGDTSIAVVKTSGNRIQVQRNTNQIS